MISSGSSTLCYVKIMHTRIELIIPSCKIFLELMPLTWGVVEVNMLIFIYMQLLLLREKLLDK